MDHLLTDGSAPAARNAIRANLFSWWRYLGSSPAATFYEDPKAMCLATGLEEPFVNPLLLAGARPAELQKIIEKAAACFGSKGIVHFSCWINETTENRALVEALIDHGLTRVTGGPGMAINLSTTWPSGTLPVESLYKQRIDIDSVLDYDA